MPLLGACGSDSPSAAASADAAAVKTLIDRGVSQATSGEYDDAAGTFDSVLVLDPDNQYAHYNLGYIAQADGDTSAALTSYDAALGGDPEFTPALYNKAYLLETSDLAQSITLYQQVTQLDPANAAAFMRLGFALVHEGKKSEGEKALATGLKLDPAMADVETPTYKK